MKHAPHAIVAFILTWAFLLFAPLPRSAAHPQGAQSPSISYEGRHVSSVELAGRPDLDLEPLRSLISQRVDAPYSQERVDETEAALKNAGHFQAVELQVTPEAAGLRLVFVLQPALYFGVFEFSNATRVFAYTRLLQIAAYPKQEPYTSQRVLEARANLLDFLHENGYFLATVEPHIQSDERRGVVNVHFQITLGLRARVGSSSTTSKA